MGGITLGFSYSRVSEELLFVSDGDGVVSRVAWFVCIVSICVEVLCCKTGVDGSLVYMFNPTILFVYGREDSVVSGCVRFVLLV